MIRLSDYSYKCNCNLLHVKFITVIKDILFFSLSAHEIEICLPLGFRYWENLTLFAQYYMLWGISYVREKQSNTLIIQRKGENRTNSSNYVIYTGAKRWWMTIVCVSKCTVEQLITATVDITTNR